MKFKFLSALAGMLILSAACVKDKKIEPAAQKDASVAFDFTALANGKTMVADLAWYTNANGDSFTVNKFNYYISNIRFKRDDGFVYAEPESYHINRHTAGQTTFTVSGLPSGNYTAVEFLIGVDSLRNSSGAQTGALDVNEGMYWDWSTGYVFFKIEGNYRTPLLTEQSDFSIHVGTTPNIKKCTFELGAGFISAAKNKQSTIYYNVNINEVFMHPDTLKLDNYHAVSGGRMAGVVSNNYKDMFSIRKVEN